MELYTSMQKFKSQFLWCDTRDYINKLKKREQ